MAHWELHRLARRSVLANPLRKWHSESVEHETNETKSNWERIFAVPASGVVFASGGAMIGSALGGPIGGLVGVTVGAVSGAAVEIISQKRHEKVKERAG